jgi:methyl-accepting chemotaxis protein
MERRRAARLSIRRGFLIFSIILFLVIFVVGSILFYVAIQDVIRTSKVAELQQTVKTERLQLESSVKGEIALVLKMAGSPLIQRYFANPNDPELEKTAFEEITSYRKAFNRSTVFWVNDIDKKFYSDSSYAFTVDTKDQKNYWYLMTLNETKTYNFNINHNPDLNNTNLWINAPVFDSKGKPLGILGAGIDITSFIQQIYENSSEYANFYFFNSTGEVTGAKDVKIVADKTLIGKLLPSNAGEKILNLSKNLSQEKIEVFITKESVFVVSEVPILGWYIVATHSMTIGDYFKNYITAVYLATVIIIILIFVIFNIFIGFILNPLKILVLTIKDISANWDLTKRVTKHYRSEIGDVSYSFNRFMEAFRLSVSEARIVTDSFASTSKELSDVSAKLTESSEDMVSQSTTMTSINEQMSESIKEMANDTEEASGSSKQVADVAEMMSTNMDSITATIDEMNTNINHIASNAEKAHGISGKATEKSNEVTSAMNKLGLAAKEIGQVTDVIKKIADKTNLLALNATIEAASAGEAGKGFAVVAGEIKELANQSAKSADNITQRIEGIQNGVSEAIVVIKDVIDIIGEINQAVETIVVNVNNQTKSSREVSDDVAQANVCLKMVSNAITEIAKLANDVQKNANTVASGASNVSKNILSMNNTAKESVKCASRASESIKRIQKMSTDLQNSIVKFKV